MTAKTGLPDPAISWTSGRAANSTGVTQLCNVHIPDWLATGGMGEDKIASFYDNPVKLACDAWSSVQSFSFRKVTMDDGPYWQAQRWARFLVWLSRGTLRRVRNRVSSASKLRARAAAASSMSSSA